MEIREFQEKLKETLELAVRNGGLKGRKWRKREL